MVTPTCSSQSSHVAKTMAACTWSEEETFKLIEVWSEGAIQAMLEGTKRNKEVYLKIAKKLEEAGYIKSGEQCSNKIKKLKFEYKKMKDKQGRTGEGRKDWKYFEVLDSALGHRPATRPPVLVDSGNTHTVCPSDMQDIDVEQDTNSTLDDSTLSDSGSSNTCRGSSACESNDSTTLIPVNHTTTPANPAAEKRRNRKRKRSANNGERVEELVGKILSMHEESDRNYMKLEEKLLKMEEQRHKDSQDFQLQLMSMMCGQQRLSYSPPAYSYGFPYYPNAEDNSPDN